MKKFLYFLFLASLGYLISSCVPQKKMIYLQSEYEDDSTARFINERKITYLLQPGDNLYIKVLSIDEQTSAMFNTFSSMTANAFNNDPSIYLNSYEIKEDGNIDFPLIGEIYVKDLTLNQTQDKIQALLNEYLKETVVIVKQVNYNVTLLGEFRRPGQYKVYQPQITIFEAIAMAGDMGDFANRREVNLVRQTKDGSKVVTLDLEKNDILMSDYYFLKPNDIIYVQPLRGKQFTFAEFPYAVVFAGLSTLILLLNYLNTR